MELAVAQLGPVSEELDALGGRHRRDPKHDLARDPEGLLAGGHHLEVAARLEQQGDELGAIETCQILKALVGVQKFFLLERLDRQRNRAGFEGLGKPLFGEAQCCFHLHPLRDFLLELLVGGLEFGRAPADGLVEVLETVLYLMTEQPLLG